MRRKSGYRRRTSAKRVVFSLLLMIVVVVAGAGGAALWGMIAAQAPGPLDEPVNVVVEQGQPTTGIAMALEREGVISDHRLFVVANYLTRSRAGSLKAGEYEFPAEASISQVLSILRSGRAIIHKVTVPEGWTSAQVVERVNAHEALIGEIKDIPPEGTLLPDTYVFQRGVERETLLARMRDAQAALIDDLWDARAPDLPFETPEEAVILASIVEKETAVAEDRQQVAAVFVNRLRRGMRLQSDPTIIYGITNGEQALDRPIRRSDIDEETPYNTYRINGLPPTPIANPGRESIAAVLQPGSTDHLYFVADGTGGHAFARTLDEHNANVRRWRQIEREARAEPAAEEADEDPATAVEQPEPAPEEAESPAEPPVEEDLEEDDAAAAPTDAAAPVPGEAPTSQDKAEAIAAAAARDGTIAPEAPAAEADATPEPEPEPDPAESLAEASVPIPLPKPRRD
ncbi:MAG TPA: endolytic transglycosylase MltG [Aestuariivirgaceae bacterium]|nr:endolytic transglycosylase MltG [Aestuariivirgaceae bacterium]